MKVYLSCGEQEDYIVVIMGCYNYCKTDICEQQVIVVEEEKESSEPVSCGREELEKLKGKDE